MLLIVRHTQNGSKFSGRSCWVFGWKEIKGKEKKCEISYQNVGELLRDKGEK